MDPCIYLCGAIGGIFSPSWGLWGGVLGPLGGLLGALGCYLKAMLRLLGPMWGHLEPCGAILGLILALALKPSPAECATRLNKQ